MFCPSDSPTQTLECLPAARQAASPRPRLFLIDAHAFLHRAYHALPPLATSKGEPVGALYGFARMLLQLVRREKPEAVVVCFDSPGPTFRHKLYPDYKATRKKPDEDLVLQLRQSREMTEAMGFCSAAQSGYEADDLMATLARRAQRRGMDAVLVTGDKDALQMVGSGVRVFNPGRNLWMNPGEIEKKFGVGPGAIVDYLSLVGDSSDNVPGVSGVGPAGAAKLLARFGGMEALLRAARDGDKEISAKTAKAIVAAREKIREAQTLIRLREDAPVDLDPARCAPARPDPKALSDLFGRLEFHSLLKEMLPEAAASALAAAASELRETEPAAVLRALKKSGSFALSALCKSAGDLADPARAVLALAAPDGSACLVDEGGIKTAGKALSGILGGRALKCGYDLKETLAVLESLGLRLAEPWFDARLAAYCLNPARPKPEPSPDDDLKAALFSRTAKAMDAESLRQRMEDAGVSKLFQDVEMPLVPVLREMEKAGIAVDAAYLRGLSREFEANIAALQSELEAMAGASVNVNSPKQMAELLFDKLQLPVLHKTEKGSRSTDEETLRVLARRHPIPAKILDFRELSKLRSTYIEGLLQRLNPETGRVHTTFDQAGTETGRLSSLNPNLQNIPIRSVLGQKIRRAFVAKRGHLLVSADYSQIDLRVLAHVSGDPTLAAAFRQNEDIHTRTACEVFRVPEEKVDKELRRRAKAVNFGIVYGQTPFGLAGELDIPQAEASAIIRGYFERYRGVSAWAEKNLEEARKNGFVRTLLGRIRYLPELSAKNAALRQFGERAARNTPIQGGSADIIKLAMLAAHRGLAQSGRKARLLLQIHDELLFEVPKAETEDFVSWIRKIMEGAMALDVPLTVDVKAGPNWQDMEARP